MLMSGGGESRTKATICTPDYDFLRFRAPVAIAQRVRWCACGLCVPKTLSELMT
jgi:hypothetical protein